MQTPPGSESASSRAATLTPSPWISSPSITTSPRLMPMRNTISGVLSRAASAVCKSTLHDTASTALANSTSRPSPITLTMAAPPLGDLRVDNLFAQRPKGGQCAVLVRTDHARIADHVGGNNGCEPALHVKSSLMQVTPRQRQHATIIDSGFCFLERSRRLAVQCSLS